MPTPVPETHAAAAAVSRRQYGILIACAVAILALLSSAAVAAPALEPFPQTSVSVTPLPDIVQPRDNVGKQQRQRDTDQWTKTKNADKGAAFAAALVGGVLALILGTLLWVAVTWWRENRSAKRPIRQAAASTVGARVETVDEEALAEGLSATLQTGGQDDLIVACWRQLEKAAASAGIERLVTETSTDFTVRVMASTTADPEAVRTLGELYREALYSPHPQTEEQIESARQAAARIVDTLRRTGAR